MMNRRSEGARAECGGLPDKNGGDDDFDAAIAEGVALLFFDGVDNVVFEMDAEGSGFDFHVDDALYDPADGIAAGDGLGDAFKNGIFEGIITALRGDFAGGSSGFAEGLADFVLGHAESDFVFGDESLHLDLAVVDFLEIGVEVGVGVNDIGGFEPTRHVAVTGATADAVGGVTEGDEGHDGAGGHGAEGALEIGVVVDGDFGGNLDDDGFGQKAFDGDGARFVGQLGGIAPGESAGGQLRREGRRLDAAREEQRGEEQRSEEQAAHIHWRKGGLGERIRFG